MPDVLSQAQEPAGRVLVVDDAEEVRTFLREALEDDGYSVRLARDGEEGIAAVEQFKPDVVLLDLMMPNVSGWDFMTHYRQLPLPRVPVIILSAIPPRALSSRALEDAAAIMPKPISVDRLLAAIGARLRHEATPGAADLHQDQPSQRSAVAA
jgi:two-component system, OmpR family, KDP operon response regulator KdpE